MITVQDFEEFSRDKLKLPEREFYRNGAGSEYTLRENIRAFDRLIFRPRFLRKDVTKRSLETSFFGQHVKIPFGVGPTAMHKIAHPDGEIATAKACEKIGCVYIMSTMSNVSIEEVASAAPRCVKWYQLYLKTDRSISEEQIRRAELSGFKAIVLTIDVPILGLRYGEIRTAFEMPSNLKLANFRDTHAEARTFTERCSKFDPSTTWDIIQWIRRRTSLPILVKGVLTREDAMEAVNHRVDGIIVSNHGGRQLDCSPPTMDVLPEIMNAVAGKVPVFVDGGFRKGTDILKALALGAKGVFLGRPIIWGLIHSGEKGVEKVLSILSNELDNAMGLSGCAKLSDINSDLVARSEVRSKL